MSQDLTGQMPIIKEHRHYDFSQDYLLPIEVLPSQGGHLVYYYIE